MKKYLPFKLIILLAVLAAGSLFVPTVNYLKASKSGDDVKQIKHYESVFSKQSYKTFQSKKVSAKSLSKGVVLVNFWASWCTPCLEEFPSLVSLRKKISDKDLKILAINSDEEDIRKNIIKTSKKYKLNFDIVADKDGEITDKFMISKIPVSILFKNGKVIEISHGAKDFVSGEFIEKLEKLIKK